jgi:hypothetical protein
MNRAAMTEPTRDNFMLHEKPRARAKANPHVRCHAKFAFTLSGKAGAGWATDKVGRDVPPSREPTICARAAHPEDSPYL